MTDFVAGCRETHKIAVVLVGEGQEQKKQALSNGPQAGSQAYHDFVDALGLMVNLDTHEGYSGNIRRNQFPGS